MPPLRIYNPGYDGDWPAISRFMRRSFPCATCKRQAEELHHRSYDNKSKERFQDLTPLCSSCHAMFTWWEKNQDEFLQWRASGQKRINGIRVRIEEISEFISERLKGTVERLLWQAEMELAGFDAMAEYKQERRAA